MRSSRSLGHIDPSTLSPGGDSQALPAHSIRSLSPVCRYSFGALRRVKIRLAQAPRTVRVMHAGIHFPLHHSTSPRMPHLRQHRERAAEVPAPPPPVSALTHRISQPSGLGDTNGLGSDRTARAAAPKPSPRERQREFPFLDLHSCKTQPAQALQAARDG